MLHEDNCYRDSYVRKDTDNNSLEMWKDIFKRVFLVGKYYKVCLASCDAMVCFDLTLLLTSISLTLHPPQTINPNPKPNPDFCYFLSKHRGLFERAPFLCWYNRKENQRSRQGESAGKTCNRAPTPLELWTSLLHDWADMNAGYIVILPAHGHLVLNHTRGLFSLDNSQIFWPASLYKTLKWYDFKNIWPTNAHKYFDRSWVLTIIMQ